MPACPLVDCHTHTSFSDGHASFEDNVRAAAAAGLTPDALNALDQLLQLTPHFTAAQQLREAARSLSQRLGAPVGPV